MGGAKRQEYVAYASSVLWRYRKHLRWEERGRRDFPQARCSLAIAGTNGNVEALHNDTRGKRDTTCHKYSVL